MVNLRDERCKNAMRHLESKLFTKEQKLDIRVLSKSLEIGHFTVAKIYNFGTFSRWQKMASSGISRLK